MRIEKWIMKHTSNYIGRIIWDNWVIKVLGVSEFINDVGENESDGTVLHQMGYEDKNQEYLRSKDCADVHV